MVWAPHLGLKGQIDVTVRVRLRRPPPPARSHVHNSNTLSNSVAPWGGELLAPLELKTGKFRAEIEHRSQLILYTLLLEERYGADVPIGARHRAPPVIGFTVM